MKKSKSKLFLLLSSAMAVCLTGAPALAQEVVQLVEPVSGPQSAGPLPDGQTDRVVVVGSQIAGAEITGALPVTVVGIDDIEATGAVSAEDLFRTIPQAGDITFAGTYLGGGNSNAARGDISTVSLRGLAQGNTLSLINGRRAVLHPTSQTDNQTPVFGYNVNAVPVSGLERVEVLKDGAAALYGSDAVAGVVNSVLRSDFVGLDLDLQYGFAEDTNLNEITGNVLYGTDFAGGRGNISLYLGGTTRTSLLASDQDYTATADRRSFVANTPWSAVTSFDTRSSSSAWGAFTAINPATGLALPITISASGVPITNTGASFHIQPTGIVTSGTSANRCRYTQGTICYGVGNTTAADYTGMRINGPLSYPDLTTQPEVERYNAFSFINYDLAENVKLYGELGYYKAKTQAVIGAGSFLAAGAISVAANAYYNPLGPVGSPSRIPGLSANVPAAGLPLTINSYTIVDGGTRDVVVDNDQLRLLAGAKGDLWGWDWDSAILYSEANVSDEADGYSSSLFQKAINRTDVTAYNPFNGGNPVNWAIGDTTVSNQAAIDSFMIKQVRENKTSLALADFKVSKPDLLTYWAGDIGMAAGVEFRHETYSDDRDARQDTSTPYFDTVLNRIVSTSDLMGHSPSPDVEGDRDVASGYIEFGVPLVSEDWNIPLVRSVDLQIAARYENYSDVGSVAKPKIAGSWDVFDGLKFRGSWSEGFKAPNLEVINIPSLERVNGYVDYIQCEADVRAGRRANFTTCSSAYTVSVASIRSGNKDLEPEESTSYNYGVVFEPKFLPDYMGSLTLTADAWHIEQENVIGLLTDDVALNYDYLLRLQGGSNPLVIRKPANQQQIDSFAGTGLTPVGDVINVVAAFTNLGPLEVEGIDYGLFWNVDAGPGEFGLNVNASNLDTYYQSPTTEASILVAAKAAGVINSGVPTAGLSYGGNTIEQGGRPKWKYSVTMTYDVDNWQFGTFTQYTGFVYQPTVLNAQAKPWKVQDQITTNAYIQYAFEGGWADQTKVRAGVRNITNEDPPFAVGDTGGWLSSLYQPLPRYWYFSARKSF